MAGFNLLPSILDKTPYGGYRTGMADERAIMHSDRDLLNQDLINQSRQMQNEDFASAGPLRMAQRAKELVEAEKLKGEMDSGQWDADRQRKRDTEEATLRSKLSDEKLTELKNRTQGAEAMLSIFPDASPVAMAGNWEQAREIAKGYQFDIGEYNKENAEKLALMMKTTPRARQLIDQAEAHKRKLELEQTEGQFGVYKEWMKQQGQDTRQAARLAAKGAGSGGGATKPPPPLTLSRAWAEAAQAETSGQPLSEAALATIEQDILTKAENLAKNDPEMRLEKIKVAFDAAKTPEEQEAAKAKLRSLIEEFKQKAAGSRYEIYKRLKAKQAPTKPQTTPATTPTAAPNRQQELRNKYNLPTR